MYGKHRIIQTALAKQTERERDRAHAKHAKSRTLYVTRPLQSDLMMLTPGAVNTLHRRKGRPYHPDSSRFVVVEHRWHAVEVVGFTGASV